MEVNNAYNYQILWNNNTNVFSFRGAYPPHLHAIYGEHAAAINFMTDEIIEGTLPNKAIKLVLEWIGLHRSELKEMWESQNFTEIAPLD